MDGDQRVIIRNLVIVTDLRLSSLRGSEDRGRYQHPDPGRMPGYGQYSCCFYLEYCIQNLKWKAAPGEVYPANLTPYSSQIFSSPAFNLLAPTAKKRL